MPGEVVGAPVFNEDMGACGPDIHFLNPQDAARAAELLIKGAQRPAAYNDLGATSQATNTTHERCDDTEEDASCPIPESEQEGCTDSEDNCETATDDPQDPACEG